MLRMSTLFVRTLREDPADAEVASHRLLIRAGYIRRAAPGIYTWLPLGPQGARQGRGDRARGDGRRGWPTGPLPGAAAARALRGHWSLDRVRPQPVPPQGPQGRGHLLAPTHEEMFTLLGEGPVLVVQGSAAVAVPNPDQVPRRGAPARGPAARPRVHHEGRVHVRHRRRGARAVVPDAARRLRPDLRAAGHRVRDRAGEGRRDGRLEVRGVPVAPPRSGRTRTCARRRVRRERRGRHARPCPDAMPTSTTPLPRTSRTPRTPRPSTTLVELANAEHPAPTAPGPPRTPSRTSCSP